MKIVILSFGILEFDGRLKELCSVFENLGHVELLCCSINEINNKYTVSQEQYLSKSNYWGFIKYVRKACKKIGKVDILLSDNIFAAFPAILAKKWLHPRYIVQDVRELYLFKEAHGTTKFFSYFEGKLMKKADVVLAANNERAKIMQKQNKLKDCPLTFENLRFLDGKYDADALDNKYNGVFHYRYNIISTSGLFMERDSDKLILAMTRLPLDFGLFFVGNSSAVDMDIFNKLCDENNISNVHILGRVTMDELKYLVKQCQIGAVHYHKKNLNNLYCASGKIYEFLHEGLPIVTTENPPLKTFCEETKTGIADDSFHNGILEIAKNYDMYRKNVEDYMKDVSPDTYNRRIAGEICAKLGINIFVKMPTRRELDGCE